MLEQEQQEYGDLVLLPGITDTYRNLPHKLAAFYHWAATEPVQFTLKTDDDCFVDLVAVMAGLTQLRGRPKLWWSQFRNNWAVERTGKWAEPDYAAMVYPPFGAYDLFRSDCHYCLAFFPF